MGLLKAYVQVLLPSGQVESSGHERLGEWQDALAAAWDRAATHVLLDAGFSRLEDGDVRRLLDGKSGGIYLTPGALGVRPPSWMEEVEPVAGSPSIYRAVVSPVAAECDAEQVPPVVQVTERPRGRPPKAAPGAAPVARREFASLSGCLEFMWASLPESDRDVLQRRLGWSGPAQTMDEIGKSRKPEITRARVGQIEQRALKGLRGLPETKAMIDRLEAVVAGCAEPVPLTDLGRLDMWFESGPVQQPWFPRLVRALSGKSLDVVEVEGRSFVLPMDRSAWSALVHEAKPGLRAAAQEETAVIEVEARMARLLPDGMEKFARLLMQAAGGADLQFANDAEGEARLVAYGRGAREIVKAVLFMADEPLHRDEILARARARSSHDVTDGTILNAIADAGLLLARGHYGHRRHLPLDDEEMSAVVMAAEEVVMASSSARQWSGQEILAAIHEQGLFDAERLDPYILGACLRHLGTRLVDLGRGVWRAGGDDVGGRLFIREFIIGLLREKGRPLTTAEIKEEIQAQRGLSPTFQIQPRDPLFRLGTATWGLIDRDLPLGLGQLESYLDAIKARLLRSGEGIHSSEVPGILQASGLDVDWLVDPELFLTLAQRRDDMRVTHSRYIVLSNWEDERRVMPASAVLLAIEQDPRQSAADLAKAASGFAKRDISPVLVRSLVNNLGYEFDRQRGEWRPESGQDG